MLKAIKVILPLLVIGIYSCKKPPCETNTPSISFVSFSTYTDTVNGFNPGKMIIRFEDCNGDIGLETEDTLAPFNAKSPYYYNLQIDYWELQKGKWTQLKDSYFNYRIPNLTPKGKTKNLEGNIEISMEPTYYDPFSPNDTLKFFIKLLDRELNVSNIIESPVIIKKN